jgi:hypothetical protein
LEQKQFKGDRIEMNRTLLFICIIALFSAVPAFAWHCPTGQHWVQVANGTPGATIVEGIPFACFPDNPPAPPAPKPTNPSSSASSSSNSSATAASNVSSTQSQKQQQTQTATGGNATNEGNNQSTSYSSTYNQVRQAPMAYAPEAFSTAACRVGFSGGASSGFGGLSLGASRKDKDCERTILANQFFARGNNTAGCKLLMHVKVIKEALTYDECLITVAPVVLPTISIGPPPVPPVTVIVQAPQPTVVTEKPQVMNVKPKAQRKITQGKPCLAPKISYKVEQGFTVKVIEEAV